MTTTYYLLLKKHLREGDIPRTSVKEFDKLIIEPNERRSKSIFIFIKIT
jgi:hypothetical protein